MYRAQFSMTILNINEVSVLHLIIHFTDRRQLTIFDRKISASIFQVNLTINKSSSNNYSSPNFPVGQTLSILQQPCPRLQLLSNFCEKLIPFGEKGKGRWKGRGSAVQKRRGGEQLFGIQPSAKIASSGAFSRDVGHRVFCIPVARVEKRGHGTPLAYAFIRGSRHQEVQCELILRRTLDARVYNRCVDTFRECRRFGSVITDAYGSHVSGESPSKKDAGLD